MITFLAGYLTGLVVGILVLCINISKQEKKEV